MNITTSQCLGELTEQFSEQLLAGDRPVCGDFIQHLLASGVSACEILEDLVWPTMEYLQQLFRDDRINVGQFNLATRLNRCLTDRLTALLTRQAGNGRTVLVLCGDDEPEELGGQICADMFEADGYTVRFAGGGIPNDEVLRMIGDFRPNLLVLFGTLASGMPDARKLIDYLREVNSCPHMQVMCCGGIYKRADGLAEEIGADLYAPDAASAIEVARENPTRKATVDQQTVGRTRRIRKAAARRAATVTVRLEAA
jgi:methanogenic corrinoid protein MtbC1